MMTEALLDLTSMLMKQVDEPLSWSEQMTVVADRVLGDATLTAAFRALTTLEQYVGEERKPTFLRSMAFKLLGDTREAVTIRLALDERRVVLAFISTVTMDGGGAE
jgi:hypothetical protein